MVKIVKKVVQRPRQIKKEREKWLSMERVINAGLSLIDPRYEIQNLIRRPDGSFEFESAIEFEPAHQNKIDNVLSLLREEKADFVQAKFYLPRRVQRNLKRRAIDLGVPASSLVAAILDVSTRDDTEATTVG